MENELILPENYKQTYNNIVKLIETAKRRVFKTANFETVYLFWHIGQELKDNILNGQKAEYGKSVVKNMSKDLEFQYGRSYEKSSIFRMIQFYEEFPDFEKVATLSQQLTWSHFKELLPVNDELKREFYAALCKNEGWSVRTLRERKRSMLYERTAISKRPEETIKNDIQLLEEKDIMTVDMFYRDPCILDFLGLQDTYSEKDLENAILAELEKFILEMGTDFAFMARQKKVTIDGRDYKIDGRDIIGTNQKKPGKIKGFQMICPIIFATKRSRWCRTGLLYIKISYIAYEVKEIVLMLVSYCRKG